MKCTNCGKNNAVYHYRFDLNGERREAHLCAECAGKLEPERQFAAKSREVFGDLFDDDFFGSDLFSGNMLKSFFGSDPFGGIFPPFATMGAPRIEISFPDMERGETGGAETGGGTGVDPELSRKRQINALRAQMDEAVKNEDFEKAAQLRDRLRALDPDKENGK